MRIPCRVTIAFLAALLVPASAVAAENRSGEQIYLQMCARCHGKTGEGTKDAYPRALAGKRSVPQLAKYIAKSMPEDDPGKCIGPDAEKVAQYIFDAFYSPVAQARNKPARIELARLTVRQYRQTMADLIGSFRSAGQWDEKRGLHGEYFKSRRFRPGERVLEREDPAIQFDFGTNSPIADKLDPNQFSIRWNGAVLAPETGEYEFIVRTEHAVRLWVNDPAHPLVDAWVKSGNDNEHRATIYLLAGRAYPVRLEFSKAKQGVDDSNKNKKKPAVKASIALLWKLPRRVPEVIPARNLSPKRFPETFALATPFPPDDRSVGYERGTSISKAWEQATTDAAIEVAGYVAAHLRELAGVNDNVSDREAKLRDFCRRFAERAFRRPLAEEQKRLYIDRQFERSPDLDTAVKRVVLFVLTSPRFLYPEISGKTDAYDTASRLALNLWDSLPDAALLDAAAKGQLVTREQIVHQAERMVTDPRAHAKVRTFFHQWLKVEQHPDLAKDTSRFPGFDAATAADLRSSLDLFLDDVLWGQASDFRQLLLADTLFLNGRLAKFYGADLPADASFQKVALDPGERAGVLTHPYMTATFAYTADSSPIHRGVFLARSILGRALRPPPNAFTPLAAELHPELTTRERVALQTKPEACFACHGMINPLGFTLEHFDAVGRFRDREKGKPIDATGFYQMRTGETVQFKGIRDLAKFLAQSDEVHDAFVEQLFHYLAKQPVRAYGAGKLGELVKSFADNQCSVRRLIEEIATTAALPQSGQQSTGSGQRSANAPPHRSSKRK